MKKITLFLLVFAMLLALVLTACDSNEPVSEDTSSTADESSVEESSIPPEEDYTIVDRVFSDKKIVILGKVDGKLTFSRRQFEFDSELEGDPINEAASERNRWIYEKYGIEVTYLANPYTADYDVYNYVVHEVVNNENTFDVITDALTVVSKLAFGGYLYDLSNISPYLNLSKPWWDQRQIDALSINNKVMYVAGSGLITDDEYTYCLLYNKNIVEANNVYEHYQVESLYDIVDNGDWTYDVFYEIAKMGTSKISGGDKMTKDDTLGVILDIGCMYYLMAGSGLTYAPKDINGTPHLDVYNEFSANLYDKILTMTNDTSTFAFTERFFAGSAPYGDAEKQFAEGRAVFYMTKLSALTTLIEKAESTTVTGVLPIPKYDSAQEGYYNPISPLHFCAFAIPITNAENLDPTCIVLEALGYLGQGELHNAYIERTLKIKRSDDIPDARMIDLILNNRSFDLGVIYNWGGMKNNDTKGLLSFFNRFAGVNATNTFASSWDEIKSVAEQDLADTLAAFN